MRPLGQMPFSCIFSIVFMEIIRFFVLIFKGGFETFSSNFQLFRCCVFGGVDNEESDLAIGRTTWKESVYDKEGERNEQTTTANHQSSAIERRALPQEEEL